jgi:hypothetical protein
VRQRNDQTRPPPDALPVILENYIAEIYFRKSESLIRLEDVLPDMRRQPRGTRRREVNQALP